MWDFISHVKRHFFSAVFEEGSLLNSVSGWQF